MKRRSVVAILVFITLSACSLNGGSIGAPQQPTATATATITASPRPTATATLEPTATSQPAATGKREWLNIGDHFSFQNLENFWFNAYQPLVYLTNLTGDYNIVLVYFDTNELGEDAVLRYLANFTVEFGLIPVEMAEGEVDGRLATVAEVAGQADGVRYVGRYVWAKQGDGEAFLAIGFGEVSDGSNPWAEEGRAAFEMILDSLHLGSNSEVGTVCEVSKDPGYGTSEENPIRVGGATLGETLAVSGLSREQSYFTALLGPNGEEIEVDRIGSFPGEGTILDAYEVTSDGFSGSRTIYVDIYHSDVPMAPAGFRCAGPFAFSSDQE